MRQVIANGNDVQLVPVVRSVDRVDGCRIADGREQAATVARAGAHDLSLPRDDAAAGGLLVELAGVAVAGIEVVLRAPHVPLRFAFVARRRAAGGAAWARA